MSTYASRARQLEGLLDSAERTRLQGLARPTDRDRYLVAHVALRQLLGTHLDQHPAEVHLVREPCPGCGEAHGRPAVAGASPSVPAPVQFSLSHAGDAVLVAFADTPVGVDVETHPSPQAAAEVAAMLHPDERAELAVVPPAGRPAAVARCWARKEAYLKGVGVGLGEDPARTYVGTGLVPAQPADWTITDVPTLSGYAAACAIRAESAVPELGQNVR